ncbi:MAG: EF-hand domain-containing protein [Alphaproteobacteria bacterium]|jgi:hypothetical protein
MATFFRFAGISVLLALSGAITPALAQPANIAGFDGDKDGRTSRAEYRTGLVSESMKFDKNRDGRVTAAELPGFTRLPGVKGAVEKVFKANDASGDGALSPEELAARAEVRFGELDVNRDGYLNSAEIKAARRSR